MSDHNIEEMFKDSVNNLQKSWTGKNRSLNEILLNGKSRRSGPVYALKGAFSFITVLTLLIFIFETGVDKNMGQFTMEDYYSVHMELGDEIDSNELGEDFLENLY